MSNYSIEDHIAYKMGFKAGQETHTARIAELEAALKPLSCSCTGFCGVMGWLPADNDSCVRRQGRAVLEGWKR